MFLFFIWGFDTVCCVEAVGIDEAPLLHTYLYSTWKCSCFRRALVLVVVIFAPSFRAPCRFVVQHAYVCTYGAHRMYASAQNAAPCRFVVQHTLNVRLIVSSQNAASVILDLEK